MFCYFFLLQIVQDYQWKLEQDLESVVKVMGPKALTPTFHELIYGAPRFPVQLHHSTGP